MILNKPGESATYGGIKYTVGESVIGTDQSEYRDLFGTISEIREDETRERPNITPEIYCSFDPPLLPDEREELEERFPKQGDAILNKVKMLPQMIQPLRLLWENKEEIRVFVVYEEWAVDDERGHSMELFTDYQNARWSFHESLKDDRQSGCFSLWKDCEGFAEESGKDYYGCYLDGKWSSNHYKLSLMVKKIPVSDALLGTLGRTYLDQSRLEDFISHVGQLGEMKAFSEAGWQRRIKDLDIAERIEKKLGNNNQYWEGYWDSISETVQEFLGEEQPQGTDKELAE